MGWRGPVAAASGESPLPGPAVTPMARGTMELSGVLHQGADPSGEATLTTLHHLAGQ